MVLVVGLGNPGTRYRETPHNAGFWVCDRLADRHAFPAESTRYQGLFRRGRIAGRDVAVLKPQTYMNLSGQSVAEALRYLPVEPGELFVVLDDMDLPAGRLRIRPSGGHGGHNGLRSIIECLGTQAFPRVRIGVGRPAARRTPTDHLLSRVPEADRARFAELAARAADALELMLGQEGVAAAMNRYNGLPGFDEAEPEPGSAP
jgi:PTH1 family peptidyl-tRNA hydrolase